MATEQHCAKPPKLPTIFEESSVSNRPKYRATLPEDLLQFIKTESKRIKTGLGRSQYEALLRCPSTTTEFPRDKTKEPFLNDMLSIFDDLLFGSTIPARTSLKFCGTRKSMLSRTLGEMRASGEHATVTIYTIMAIGKTHTERLWHCAATLLHEMVHAYIALYISHDHERRAKPLAVRGDSGHGFLWHDIAYVVETSFNAVTGAKIDVGRQMALLRELSVWPKTDWKDVNTVEKWGLEPEWLRERVSRKFSEAVEAVRKSSKK